MERRVPTSGWGPSPWCRGPSECSAPLPDLLVSGESWGLGGLSRALTYSVSARVALE